MTRVEGVVFLVHWFDLVKVWTMGFSDCDLQITGVLRPSVERLQELAGWGTWGMCLGGSRAVSERVCKSVHQS